MAERSLLHTMPIICPNGVGSLSAWWCGAADPVAYDSVGYDSVGYDSVGYDSVGYDSVGSIVS
jgi:hypothetical protein